MAQSSGKTSFTLDVNMDQSAGLPSKGVHRARCNQVELTTISKGNNKGEPMLIFDFETLTKGEEGRRVRYWQPILPQTAWKYTPVLAAFGIQANAKSMAKVTHKDFVGKVVRIVVDHGETPDGDPRAEVRNVLPDGAGTARAQDPATGLERGVNADDLGLTTDSSDDLPEEDLPF